MKAQSSMPAPEPQSDQSVKGKVVNALPQLVAWPKLVIELIRKPKEVIATLPTSGSWEPVLIYMVTASLVVGVGAFLTLLPISFGWGIRGLIVGAVTMLISVPIQAAVLNLILGILGKEPGLYRTAYFLSILSLIPVAGVILAQVLGASLSLVVSLLSLYPIYHFTMQVSGLSKEKAWGCLIAIYLLGVGMSSGWFWQRLF